MLKQYEFEVATQGRGLIDITENIKQFVADAGINTGLCHIFLQHTSASLIICENFDPLVQQDLEAFMQRLTPDADPLFQHTAEGPDDMPSHVRTILTQTFLLIPVTANKLVLGRWQGLYLWEHRLDKHERKMTVTVQG